MRRLLPQHTATTAKLYSGKALEPLNFLDKSVQVFSPLEANPKKTLKPKHRIRNTVF